MFDELTVEERRQLGHLRARDAAYDAIFNLWKKREADGLTQKEVADFLDKDPAWVSRALSGPSNWTMKTLGELAEALDGLLFITAVHVDDYKPLDNYDIYADWADSCSNMQSMDTVVIGGGRAAATYFIPAFNPEVYKAVIKR